MNKHIAGNVIFLWQLLENNHNFVLANSAQATSGEAPAPPMDTALHCTKQQLIYTTTTPTYF